MPNLPEVVIYTDGACIGNPGPGGYGAVLLFGRHRKELSDGYQHTTNNRMEILATIKALESLKKKCYVKLYSDSKYVVDCLMKGYARRWRANNWMQKSKRASNVDLWQQLLALAEQHHVEFIWVKGHSGINENERCDELATQAAQLLTLKVDEGYLKEQSLHLSNKMTKEAQPHQKSWAFYTETSS